MKFRWIRQPAKMPINAVTVWEHTPLNPWAGEYPRFIRPIRDECRAEQVKLYEDGSIARAGELPSNV